jgi:hypothetical protein
MPTAHNLKKLARRGQAIKPAKSANLRNRLSANQLNQAKPGSVGFTDEIMSSRRIFKGKHESYWQSAAEFTL